MLDDFHGEHDVECLAGRGQRLGGRRAIIDGEPGRGRVSTRDADILLGGIGADDIRPEPGHRLREQPAAAADIEKAEPGERAWIARRAGRSAPPPRRG